MGIKWPNCSELAKPTNMVLALDQLSLMGASPSIPGVPLPI